MRPRRPWFDLEPLTPDEGAHVAVVGIPFDGAVSLRRGAALAPARIRELSRTSDAVSRRGHVVRDLRVCDLGDVAPAPGESQQELFARVRSTLVTLPRSTCVVALGGDNSISIPCVEAFAIRQGGSVGVIWLDAHPDLWELYDGNPDSHACALHSAMTRAAIPPERVAILGTRSYAISEVELARDRGIRMIAAADLVRRDTATLVEDLARQMAGVSGIYLAVDIDAFDASCAPGTGYPMPGGPSSETLLALIEAIVTSMPVAAIDVTEVAPPLDHNDMTSFLAAQVVLEALSALERRQLRAG